MLKAVSFILWIVAGDDLEQAGGVLDGAAQRSHARNFSPAPTIPSRLTSSCVGASPTRLLFLGGLMDGIHRSPRRWSTSLDSRPSMIRSRPLEVPGLRSRIVRVTERPAEGAARVRRSHFSEVGLAKRSHPPCAQALDERCVVRRSIVRISDNPCRRSCACRRSRTDP